MTRVEVVFDSDGTVRFDFDEVNLSSSQQVGAIVSLVQNVRDQVTVKSLVRDVEKMKGSGELIKHVAQILQRGYSKERHGQATWCGGPMRHGGHEFGLPEYEPDRPRWCLGMPNNTVPGQQAEGCGQCPEPLQPDEAFHPGWQAEHVVKNDPAPHGDAPCADPDHDCADERIP